MGRRKESAAEQQQKAIGLSAKHRQAKIIQTVGERFKAARELCGLSQSDAARLLGYANPSKLSKVENAMGAASVPLWLFTEAARLYQVSIDYLFGMSETFDTSSRLSQERQTAAWLFEEWNRLRVRDTVAMRRLCNRIEAVDKAVTFAIERATDITEAMQAVVRLNPDFADTMRGGARLIAAIERADDASRHCLQGLEAFRRDCRLSSDPKGGQMQLPLDEEAPAPREG